MTQLGWKLWHQPLLYYPAPQNPIGNLIKPLNSYLSPQSVLCRRSLKSRLSSKHSFKCFCDKTESTHDASSQGFSALAADAPWDSGSVCSTMAFYMLSLHIPLSFGGLSVVAHLLHQPSLDPQIEAISLLGAQILELIAALILLQSTAKRQYKFEDFFKDNKLSKDRSWLLASAIGFGVLFMLVFLTSFIADSIVGPKVGMLKLSAFACLLVINYLMKEINNPVLKEILLSGNISIAACVLVYCVVTPVLEEIVYRGFLLGSISSTMKWQSAVLISSAVFSAGHLSGENFLQLFIIGCVLGCSHSWTGNLRSPILMHSLYNAMTLMITFLS